MDHGPPGGLCRKQTLVLSRWRWWVESEDGLNDRHSSQSTQNNLSEMGVVNSGRTAHVWAGPLYCRTDFLKATLLSYTICVLSSPSQAKKKKKKKENEVSTLT
jgi:hypothetical protein